MLARAAKDSLVGGHGESPYPLGGHEPMDLHGPPAAAAHAVDALREGGIGPRGPEKDKNGGPRGLGEGLEFRSPNGGTFRA